MKRAALALTLLCGFLTAGVVYANSGDSTAPKESNLWTLPNHFLGDLVAAFGFGTLVVVLVIAGYKVVDWALKGVDFDAELTKGNVSVGIVVASIILGICYAVSSVVVAIIG